MNSNFSGRDGRNYQTHRSDRYRHPERDDYRFDDYGSSARGGYGNESNTGTWGNQGNEMGGSRNTSRYNQDYNSFSNSPDYGRRDSYSGERGGYSARHPQESDRDDSGYSRRGSSRSHFGDSDYDNYERLSAGNRSHSYRDDRDLYGSESSRRFQGTDQGHYNFDQDDKRYRGGDYSDSQGNYRGSGYRRSSQNEYGSRRHDYGAQYPQDMYGGSDSGDRNDQPYGMSGYYSGGYGDRNPGGGFVSSGSNYSDKNYLESRNRVRTFDRDRNYSERY